VTVSTGARSGARLLPLLGGVVLGIVAIMMASASLRATATALARDGFVHDQIVVEHFRDGPGRGQGGFGGHVVSTGEQLRGTDDDLVGIERLRELDGAGRLIGERFPVYFLPAGHRWAFVDYLVRFRVQNPEQFEMNYLTWILVNLAMASAAVFLVRREIRRELTKQRAEAGEKAAQVRTPRGSGQRLG
jgi:hypothetical protein